MARQKIGQYDVEEIIGDGGMGTVYRARDPRFDRQVAIKVLHSQFRRDPNVAERFKNEAVIQAKLNHPNIVTVYDFIVDDDVLAFVMEHVEGDSLEGLIEQSSGPISSARCSEIMRQALSAMGYAHSQGLVHRDLKPSNILIQQVGGDDVVKVMDFGIAKILGDEKMRTATGATMGTLAYMSPEHMRSSKAVDSRSDIYSLGATFFELITGKTPIHADTEFDLMCRIVDEPAQPPSTVRSDVPSTMDQAILCSLEKDPDRRFPTCEQFRDALTGGRGSVVVQADAGQSAEMTDSVSHQQWSAPPEGAQPAPPPMVAQPPPDPRYAPRDAAPGLQPGAQPPPVVMPENTPPVYAQQEDAPLDQVKDAWVRLDTSVKSHVIEVFWQVPILLCGVPMVLVSLNRTWSFLSLSPVLGLALIVRWVVHSSDFTRTDGVKLPVVIFDAQVLIPFRFHEVLTSDFQRDQWIRSWGFFSMVITGMVGAWYLVRIAIFSSYSINSLFQSLLFLAVSVAVWMIVLWSISAVAARLVSILVYRKGVRDSGAPIDLSQPLSALGKELRKRFDPRFFDDLAGPLLWLTFGMYMAPWWWTIDQRMVTVFGPLTRLFYALLGTVFIALIWFMPAEQLRKEGFFRRLFGSIFRNPFRESGRGEGEKGGLARKTVLVLCVLAIGIGLRSLISGVLLRVNSGFSMETVAIGTAIALVAWAAFIVGMSSTALTAVKSWSSSKPSDLEL